MCSSLRRTRFAGRLGHGARRRAAAVQRQGPAALPRQGAAVPRRVLANAQRVQVRVRPADDRASRSNSTSSTSIATRRCATPRCSTRSPTTTSRPSSASSTSRSTSRRAGSPATTPNELETGAARQPERRRGAVEGDRHAHRDDRNPADARARTPHPRVAERQPALRADQRADLRSPRRGHHHRHRRRRAARHLDRHDRTRVGVHVGPVPPAGEPAAVRRELERRAVHRRRAGRARRQLAVPLRQGTVARDPHRVVRAGHRHPFGGAEGPGRASAGLVRRTVDHLDLRPVRRERALLPVPAADRRRRGPGRGARPRRHAHAVRAAHAQRHDLPLEPAGVRRAPRQAAPAGREPRAARRPDRRRRAGQRARSTTACCAR